MELRDRLKSISKSSSRPRASSPRSSPLPYLLPLENECGCTYYCDQIYIDYHGQIDFKAFPGIDVDVIRFLSRQSSLKDFRLEDTIFLDIETTGTAGGTGTYAFLVGLGFVEHGYFQIRQFFLHDLAEERAFLQALESFSNRFHNIVTYNGKCFDAQILRNRYLMHRKDDPFEAMQHIDMLFIARRLWKRRFRECNLINLERNLLGFERGDDIPGYLIPSAYTDYLRYASAGMIQKVIRHNRWDIASLAVLMARACLLLHEQELSPEEHFSLSLLFEREKEYTQALRHQQRALLLGSSHRNAILLAMARNLRRIKDHESMSWLLQQTASESADHALCRQMSILCEHELKDPVLALQYTNSQIHKLERFQALGKKNNEELKQWYHRRNRLFAKLQRINARIQ